MLSQLVTSVLKMEATRFSETLACSNRSTRRLNAKEHHHKQWNVGMKQWNRPFAELRTSALANSSAVIRLVQVSGLPWSGCTASLQLHDDIVTKDSPSSWMAEIFSPPGDTQGYHDNQGKLEIPDTHTRIQLWRQAHHGPRKRWCLPTSSHGVTTLKTNIDFFTLPHMPENRHVGSRLKRLFSCF
jgi:hypothetical protein